MFRLCSCYIDIQVCNIIDRDDNANNDNDSHDSNDTYNGMTVTASGNDDHNVQSQTIP